MQNGRVLTILGPAHRRFSRRRLLWNASGKNPSSRPCSSMSTPKRLASSSCSLSSWTWRTTLSHCAPRKHWPRSVYIANGHRSRSLDSFWTAYHQRKISGTPHQASSSRRITKAFSLGPTRKALWWDFARRPDATPWSTACSTP